MFDAIRLMLPPRARIVDPASLSDILYLHSLIIFIKTHFYLSLIFSIAGIKYLSHITPNPQKIYISSIISTNNPPEPSSSEDFINCSKVLEYKDDLSFILNLQLKMFIIFYIKFQFKLIKTI